MYFSLNALETPKPQDDIQWLTYWVVFGFFNFVETFVSFVLYWFPFYYTFKTLAIVWLMLPQTQGQDRVPPRSAPSLPLDDRLVAGLARAGLGC